MRNKAGVSRLKLPHCVPQYPLEASSRQTRSWQRIRSGELKRKSIEQAIDDAFIRFDPSIGGINNMPSMARTVDEEEDDEDQIAACTPCGSCYDSLGNSYFANRLPSMPDRNRLVLTLAGAPHTISLRQAMAFHMKRKLFASKTDLSAMPAKVPGEIFAANVTFVLHAVKNAMHPLAILTVQMQAVRSQQAIALKVEAIAASVFCESVYLEPALAVLMGAMTGRITGLFVRSLSIDTEECNVLYQCIQSIDEDSVDPGEEDYSDDELEIFATNAFAKEITGWTLDEDEIEMARELIEDEDEDYCDEDRERYSSLAKLNLHWPSKDYYPPRRFSEMRAFAPRARELQALFD